MTKKKPQPIPRKTALKVPQHDVAFAPPPPIPLPPQDELDLSPVCELMSELDRKLALAFESLDLLEDNLASVLCSETDEAGKIEPKTQPCPLCKELDDHVVTAARIGERIQGILRRLQL